MDKKMVETFYGSFLHDIGKAVQRQSASPMYDYNHQILGSDFIENYTDDKQIIDALYYHHNQRENKKTNLRQAEIPEDSVAYLTYIGDNIAAGTDRRYEECGKGGWDHKTPLADIFNRFGIKQGQRYLHPYEMKPEFPSFMDPSNAKDPFSPEKYQDVVRLFKEGLNKVELTEEYIPSVLNLVEQTMGQVPSDTAVDGEPDISLYDHMKLSAAFACAIKQYLDEQNRHDYKATLLNGERSFYKKQAFLMVSYQLAGTEDFINTITSQGAYKQLRSRAFYVEMLMRWFLDSLLNEVGLTAANILYQNSHDGLLFIGNTTRNAEIVREAQGRFNEFLLKNFGTKLYLAVGMEEFSAEDIKAVNKKDPNRKEGEYKRVAQNYAELFQRLDRDIEHGLQKRYDMGTLKRLNAFGKKSGRECAVCHSVMNLLPGENKCFLCDKLESFSQDIQVEKYFVVNEDKTGLPLDADHYLHTIGVNELEAGDVSGKIYTKNTYATGKQQATHIWISDYSNAPHNNFSYFSDREWKAKFGEPTGIKRLASLMIDIDDLHAKFLTGFYPQEDGKYTTISRFAELSRRIDMFFKLYLNQYADDYHLSIIYSQGDDAFILGAWDDLLDFVQDVRDEFVSWTDNKITLSAAVGLFQESTPINIIARQTKELLRTAKFAGKDRIVLFSKENILTFDEYKNDIVMGKQRIIQEFFDGESERGKSFIYKLLSLIREREDRISFARLAYFLTRLEDASSNKEGFNKFKRNIMNWFNDDKEISQTELALTLYVYSIREEG
ncbi:type III-A CRISPR-associated protein Cas10/Csm1 [Lactobacillus delbrueckii subsp. bulgaricus]|nr:type III-A CRISPR-associated protein Cas10/Csm1 [Lactobacillus delbrueckii subsp. bulgaricus]